jgi:hypothetical protein
MRGRRLILLIVAVAAVPVAFVVYTLASQRVALNQLHHELVQIDVAGLSIESVDIDWTCADNGPKSVRIFKMEEPATLSDFTDELDRLGFQFDGYGRTIRPRSDAFDGDWVHREVFEDRLVVTAGQVDRDGCTFVPIYGY